MKPADQIIAESIDYLVSHYEEAPGLDYLANRAGYEATYFQKLFKDKVGLSPRQLIGFMHMKQAGELLGRGSTTLAAAYEAGLSGNGRLHDLCVTCAGMTPGNMARRGKGLVIAYGLYAAHIGTILIAKTPIGVCYLGFLMEESANECMARMTHNWPLAEFIRDDTAIAGEGQQILDIWRGKDGAGTKLPLDLYGTNFQLQIWQALLRIPAGHTVTYQGLAAHTGRPKASRAVGNAVGANPVALLIPCHRVIRATGIIDNYGWGSPRKKLLLGLESA